MPKHMAPLVQYSDVSDFLRHISNLCLHLRSIMLLVVRNRLLHRMDSLIGKSLVLEHCANMSISTVIMTLVLVKVYSQKANSSKVLPKVSGKKK